MSNGEASPPSAVDPGKSTPVEKGPFELAAAKLDVWTPAADDLPKIMAVVQRSLDTTTKLTEYEDGKAARVLTAMAFVSALAVALHNLTVNQIGPDSSDTVRLVHFVYLSYYGSVILGSICILYAIFPRFNIPKKRPPHPLSLIFSPEIVRVKHDAWVEQFTTRTGVELQMQSVRNEVLEARLVAEKCAFKIARLKIGMALYLAALGIFILALATSFNWLVLHHKTNVKPSQSLLIVDADNTLWGTNEVYAAAQTALLETVAKAVSVPAPADAVGYVRAVEEQLAATGRGFNLPPDLVARTLAQKLIGSASNTTFSNVAVGEINQAAGDFERALRRSPPLFPGVVETLRRLRNQGYRMVLFSESDPVLLENRLKDHDLKKYFERVFSGAKNLQAFREIGNEFTEIVGKNVVSVGDRLDVDVQYPMQAGFKAVWIPASFKPKAANVAATPTISLTAFSDLPEKLPGVLNHP